MRRGQPVRDQGSVTYSAAIERARTCDTDDVLSEFAQRVLHETTQRLNLSEMCYAARDIRISSTVGENVDLPNANMTLINFKEVRPHTDYSLSAYDETRCPGPVQVMARGLG
jgi:hypothetical protein